MLYSRTSKYAVLALAELARRESGTPQSTRDIAREAEVPYPLLAKILLQLKHAGLVESLRGKQGGIRLARSAEAITIRQVVTALDGDELLFDCPLYLEACACERECDLHGIWKPARDAVVTFLDKTTIHDIAEARKHGT